MHTYAKDLVARIEKGTLKEVLMFKGEFSWLSNMYQHYSMETTSEHVYQAMKHGEGTIGYRNTMLCKSPYAAKKLGRTAKLPDDWHDRRITVMRDALREKFARRPMRDWLIATYDISLTEGNYWHDNFWGSCNCSKCSNIPGTNMLGLLLMEVRGELIDEDVLAWTEAEVDEILFHEERVHRGE